MCEHLKESERKAMMGLLKEFTQDIQSKAWLPFGKKDPEPQIHTPLDVEKEKKAKSFCDPSSKEPCLTVCAPKKGCECGCAEIRESLKNELALAQLEITPADAKVGCDGKCKNGPFVGFPQKGFFYINVRPDDVPLIVNETIKRGRLLHHLLSIDPDRSYRSDLFFDKQTGLLAGIHDHVCMVEAAKYFLDFEEGLSCGKCVPCRIGMKRMQESIDRIVTGKGTSEDLEQIRSLCETMLTTPHCDFAMASSKPVLSAMKYFMDEFKAHIENQECPAGVCKDLVEIQRKRAVRQRLSGKKKK